jgi:hypothetical protein
MAAGSTAKVKVTLASAVTPATGVTVSYPLNTSAPDGVAGFDMSRVEDWHSVAIFLNDAGDGANSTTSTFTIEYSQDGSTWFTPLASGVDSFTAVTTTASKQVRKLSVSANWIRFKMVISGGASTSGAKTVDLSYVSKGGSYSV